MKHSKLLLTRRLATVPNKLAIFLLIVALLGFADATYLTIEHYRGVIPPCTTVTGCETVLVSEYSTIAGIPVSLLGSVYYLLVLVGILAYVESKNIRPITWALRLTPIGFIFSLWFLYLQAFVIGAYCQYCLGSAATSTVLFVTALIIFARYDKKEIGNDGVVM